MNSNNAMPAMDCKGFQKELPDLVLTANARPSVAAAAHLRACPPCAEEYLSFQATFTALDRWTAPLPSAFFDQKLAVLVREEQLAPGMSWFESLQSRLLFNTNRSLRPLMVGALALVLVVSGGGIAGINYANVPVQPSATVNDLQILDRNEEAFQQLDELQQEDEAAPSTTGQPTPVDSTGAPVPAPPPAS